MATLDLRPHTLNVQLFPGSKGIILVELFSFASDAVVKAVIYLGTGVNVNKLESEKQPTVDKIDDQNWKVTFEAAKTRSYDSKDNTYSLDILVNDEVLASGQLTASRELRTTADVAGDPIPFVWKANKIVLTPNGALPQAFFDFRAPNPAAVQNQHLEHNLNCDDVEFIGFDASGERLYEATAKPLQQLGFNPNNIATLSFPVGSPPAYGYIRSFNR